MTELTWSTALPDWEERIRARKSLIPCDPLFPDEAAAAMEIFCELKMVDVAGAPTIGEAGRPWVKDFASAVFGAYDARTGRRLIQYFLLLVAKKNGKSTVAAGVMLTALLRNWRQSGEYYILAPTKEVADNSYKPARDMVRADPELSQILRCQDNFRTITHRNTGAFLKVVAADNEVVAGKKTIGLFVDELWLFGKKPNADNILLEAMGGLASRPEGFVIYASTQGDEPPSGVFKQTLHRFRDIRDGTLKDPRSLGVAYEFPPKLLENGDFKLRQNWYITNPNLGASVDEEFIAQRFATAERSGKAELTSFFAKHLNVEIGQTTRLDRWAGAEYWEAAGDKTLTLDELVKRSEVVTVGADGGGLDDLFGLAVIGREKVTGRWLVWAKAWAHSIVLERRKDIAAQLKDFNTDGDLEIVKVVGDDVEEAAEIVKTLDDAGLLPAQGGIGVDRIGIGSLMTALAERGIVTSEEQPRIVGISQGFALSGAIKDAERALAGGKVVHAGRPMMAWCVGNARVEPRGNAILITKQISGSAKIDPVMAFFNAVSLMTKDPTPRDFDGSGVIVLDAA